MPITEAKLKGAISKTRAKPEKITDANGLYAYVSEVGGVSWRYDYIAPSGNRRTLTIGRWPAIPILARFSDEEFQTKVGFALMSTIIPLQADLGRIVDEGDIVQSLSDKYGVGLESVVKFGAEVMNALE